MVSQAFAQAWVILCVSLWDTSSLSVVLDAPTALNRLTSEAQAYFREVL